jgi:hypothetical protein
MTIPGPVLVYAPIFVPREYDVFAGLDVDHHSIAVTFTDHQRLMQSLRLPYSARQLLSYVGKHFPGQRLAFVYEAGPTGFGLYDELAAAGHACLVVAPPMVPRAPAPGQRVKTNRLDSRKLSTALRGGDLKSIHVPAAKYRELRHLVQLRDTCVGQLTATKCRIKALLLYEGIPFPQTRGKRSRGRSRSSMSCWSCRARKVCALSWTNSSARCTLTSTPRPRPRNRFVTSVKKIRSCDSAWPGSRACPASARSSPPIWWPGWAIHS